MESFRDSALVRTVIAGGLLAIVTLVYLTPSTAGGGSRTPLYFGPDLTTSECNQLQPQVGLNQTVSGIYAGLANLSQNWNSGPNETPPVGISGYPPESVAEQNLESSWQAICQSPVYAAIWNASSQDPPGGGLELNMSSGTYQVYFELLWHSNCSLSSAPDGCTSIADWWVDLATGREWGPIVTQQGPPPPGFGPPPLL